MLAPEMLGSSETPGQHNNVKPWELTNSTGYDHINHPSSLVAPPLPTNNIQAPFVQGSSAFSNISSNWATNGGYNIYGRPGYPLNYSTNYNYPFNMNTGLMNGAPPAPGSFITSSLENTTRPLFESLNHILQSINHVACFIDSTVFAVWTSVTAFGSIAVAIKKIREVFIRRCLDLMSDYVSKLKLTLKSTSGRKRILVLMSVIAVVPIILKLIIGIIKIEENSEKSLVRTYSSNDIELDTKGSFVRASYVFDPSDKDSYLTLNPGDVILVSKEDAQSVENNESKWILGKLKNGSSGYFPSNYVILIK
jgi:hypothetical protein